jgi:hypothetical protein
LGDQPVIPEEEIQSSGVNYEGNLDNVGLPVKKRDNKRVAKRGERHGKKPSISILKRARSKKPFQKSSK